MKAVAELREMTFQFSARTGDAVSAAMADRTMMDFFMRTSPDRVISLLIAKKFNPPSPQAVAEVSPLSDGRLAP
ncbi:hypothetical protein HMPREF0185_02855 [Brevundimonas diminuta 470-4]|nr:hypothetical protein HMPREF0185_02855 [Brevundimonas diminuta 470-4]